MNTRIVYHEEIIFKSAIVLLGLAVIGLIYAVFTQLFVGPVGSNPAETWVLATCILIFAALMAIFYKLTITATPNGITVGYMMFAKHIPWGDILAFEQDDTSEISYLGFGIRFARINGKWRMVYNVLGAPRITLTLKTGGIRQFTFSTKTPDELLEILKSNVPA